MRLTAMPLCALLGAVCLLYPAQAHPCGGVFCASNTSVPEPVDQTAERVLFVVHPTTPQVICAHVEIQYVGEAQRFAWIVPVPDTPEVDESSLDLFDALDAATRPVTVDPPLPSCAQAMDSSASCGGSGEPSRRAAPRDLKPLPGVNVVGRYITDRYEAAALDGIDAQAVVNWLQHNDFTISDNMVPALTPYADQGMKFLAVRLRADRSAHTLPPIRMCYEADAPSLPLRLTAVAAQPLMGVTVFVLADEAYKPVGHTTAWPEDHTLSYAATSGGGVVVNYFEQVARQVAEADGRLLIREYLGDPPPAPDDTVEDRPWPLYPAHQRRLTRFYTRLNPTQMTEDLTFVPDYTDPPPDRATLDLSTRPPAFDCNGQPAFSPDLCDFMWCGLGAACIEDAQGAGCQCASGQVAQAITSPTGRPQVTCVPAENPVAVPPDLAGAGSAVDPCDLMDCGLGACVLRGGFPTCQCEAETMARLRDGALTCAHPEGEPIERAPVPGGSNAGQLTTQPGTGCATTLKRHLRSDRVLFLSLIGLMGLWRLRRRR